MGCSRQSLVASAARWGCEATPGPRIPSLETSEARRVRTRPVIEHAGDYAAVSLTGDVDLTATTETSNPMSMCSRVAVPRAWASPHAPAAASHAEPELSAA